MNNNIFDKLKALTDIDTKDFDEFCNKLMLQASDNGHKVPILAITIDFTEHDKMFKDKINQLKYELSKKTDFETDKLVKLPFDALETANMLINATYKRENCMNGKVYDKDIYSIDDLEQIAEHLLVYCKHHREDAEL